MTAAGLAVAIPAVKVHNPAFVRSNRVVLAQSSIRSRTICFRSSLPVRMLRRASRRQRSNRAH